jgi:hypothetical protein
MLHGQRATLLLSPRHATRTTRPRETHARLAIAGRVQGLAAEAHLDARRDPEALGHVA